MPQRMDVELTSARDDETFTWRAAGAKQPRGAVPASLLPKGSKVGDILRVEAEVEIDGITVVSVLPAKAKEAPKDRIEVLGSGRPVPGVTTTLAGPPDRRRESRFFREGGDERRPGRPGGDRRPRQQGEAPAEGRSRPPRAGGPPRDADEERAASRSRSEGSRPARGRPREGSEVASARRDLSGPSPAGRRQGARSATSPAGAPTRRQTVAGAERAGTGPDRPGRPRRGPVRLEPGTKHRDALMATLPPEQQRIAERLAVGGMPGMRKAIADEEERARAEGRPPVAADSILAIAEQLQPDVKAAVWMDRAEAAIEHVDELGLRDLRATVVAAAPRDDAGRELERRLREGLDRRVSKLRSDWEAHLGQALAEGKVLQALRLSARPPEPTARFPASLIEPLVTQVSAAMSPEASPERWLALLEAAVVTPIRRQIKPAGIPKDPSGEVGRKAREAAGRIPALAHMLGMAMPPPPKPIPGERPGRPQAPRPARSARPARPPRPRSSRPEGRPARPPAAAEEGASGEAVPHPVHELAQDQGAVPAGAEAPVEAAAAPAHEPVEAPVEAAPTIGLEPVAEEPDAPADAEAPVEAAPTTAHEPVAEELDAPADAQQRSGEDAAPSVQQLPETAAADAEQPAGEDAAAAVEADADAEAAESDRTA